MLGDGPGFRAMFEHSPVAQVLVYPHRAGLVANPAFASLFGYDRRDLAGMSMSDLVHQHDERDVLAVQRRLAHGNVQRVTVEREYVRGDGSVFTGRAHVSAVLDEQGRVEYLLGVVDDITAQRQATDAVAQKERALRSAEAQFRAVFEHAPFSVSIIDLEGRIIDINYAGCAILGRTRQELAGTQAQDTVHPDDIERAIETTSRQLAGNDTAAEFRLMRADGTSVWVMSSASLLETGGDEEPYVVTVQADITERRSLEARLEHEATRDPLTGVMNRGALMTQLELALLQRHVAPLGVLFIDLDYFKSVNDTFGHEAGDAVLSTIAKRLRDCVREGDVIGRLGGDEFVVLCHDVSGLGEAVDVGERLRRAITRPIDIRGGTARVDASVGIALAHAGSDAAGLLRAADKASYAAKEAGRGRVAVAEQRLELVEPAHAIERSA